MMVLHYGSVIERIAYNVAWDRFDFRWDMPIKPGVFAVVNARVYALGLLTGNPLKLLDEIRLQAAIELERMSNIDVRHSK